jgi:hypothetical protein
VNSARLDGPEARQVAEKPSAHSTPTPYTPAIGQAEVERWLQCKVPLLDLLDSTSAEGWSGSPKGLCLAIQQFQGDLPAAVLPANPDEMVQCLVLLKRFLYARGWTLGPWHPRADDVVSITPRRPNKEGGSA